MSVSNKNRRVISRKKYGTRQGKRGPKYYSRKQHGGSTSDQQSTEDFFREKSSKALSPKQQSIITAQQKQQVNPSKTINPGLPLPADQNDKESLADYLCKYHTVFNDKVNMLTSADQSQRQQMDNIFEIYFQFINKNEKIEVTLTDDQVRLYNIKTNAGKTIPYTSKYTNLISLIINSVLGDNFIDHVINRTVKLGDAPDLDKNTQLITDKHLYTKSLANTFTTNVTKEVSTNYLVRNIYQRFFLNLDKYQLNNKITGNSDLNEAELRKNIMYKFFNSCDHPSNLYFGVMTNVFKSKTTNTNTGEQDDAYHYHERLRDVTNSYHDRIIHVNYPHPLKFIKRDFRFSPNKNEAILLNSDLAQQIHLRSYSHFRSGFKATEININANLVGNINLTDKSWKTRTKERFRTETNKYHPGSFKKTREELYKFRQYFFLPMIHNKEYMNKMADGLMNIIIDTKGTKTENYVYLSMIQNNLFDILEENIDKKLESTFLADTRLCFYLIIFFYKNFLVIPQNSETILKHPLIYYYTFIWGNAQKFKEKNRKEIESIHKYFSNDAKIGARQTTFSGKTDDTTTHGGYFKFRRHLVIDQIHKLGYHEFISRTDMDYMGSVEGRQPVALPYLRWIIFDIDSKIGDVVKTQKQITGYSAYNQLKAILDQPYSRHQSINVFDEVKRGNKNIILSSFDNLDIEIVRTISNYVYKQNANQESYSDNEFSQFLDTIDTTDIDQEEFITDLIFDNKSGNSIVLREIEILLGNLASLDLDEYRGEEVSRGDLGITIIYGILTELLKEHKINSFSVSMFKILAKTSVNLRACEEPMYSPGFMRDKKPQALKKIEVTFKSIKSSLNEIKRDKTKLIKSIKKNEAKGEIDDEEELQTKIKILKDKMEKKVQKDPLLQILCRIIFYIKHCSSTYVLSGLKVGQVNITEELFDELKRVLQDDTIDSILKNDLFSLIKDKNLFEKENVPKFTEDDQDPMAENIFVTLFKFSEEADISDTKELLLYYASTLSDDENLEKPSDLSGQALRSGIGSASGVNYTATPATTAAMAGGSLVVNQEDGSLEVSQVGGGFADYSDALYKYLYAKYWNWYNSIQFSGKGNYWFQRVGWSALRVVLKGILFVVGVAYTIILFSVIKIGFGFLEVIFGEFFGGIAMGVYRVTTTKGISKTQSDKIKKMSENLKQADINNEGILARLKNVSGLNQDFIVNNIQTLISTPEDDVPRQIASIVTTYLIFDTFGDTFGDLQSLLQQNDDIIKSRGGDAFIKGPPKVQTIFDKIKDKKKDFVETKDLISILIRIYNDVSKINENVKKISLRPKKIQSNPVHQEHIGIMVFYSAFYYFQFHAAISDTADKSINDQAIKDVNEWFEKNKRDMKAIAEENIFNIFMTEYTRNLFQSKDNILFLTTKLGPEHIRVLNDSNIKQVTVSVKNQFDQLTIRVKDESRIRNADMAGSQADTSRDNKQQVIQATIFIAHLCDFLNIISIDRQKLDSNESVYFNKFEVNGMDNSRINEQPGEMKTMRSIYGALVSDQEVQKDLKNPNKALDKLKQNNVISLEYKQLTPSVQKGIIIYHKLIKSIDDQIKFIEDCFNQVVNEKVKGIEYSDPNILEVDSFQNFVNVYKFGQILGSKKMPDFMELFEGIGKLSKNTLNTYIERLNVFKNSLIEGISNFIKSIATDKEHLKRIKIIKDLKNINELGIVNIIFNASTNDLDITSETAKYTQTFIEGEQKKQEALIKRQREEVAAAAEKAREKAEEAERKRIAREAEKRKMMVVTAENPANIKQITAKAEKVGQYDDDRIFNITVETNNIELSKIKIRNGVGFNLEFNLTDPDVQGNKKIYKLLSKKINKYDAEGGMYRREDISFEPNQDTNNTDIKLDYLLAPINGQPSAPQPAPAPPPPPVQQSNPSPTDSKLTKHFYEFGNNSSIIDVLTSQKTPKSKENNLLFFDKLGFLKFIYDKKLAMLNQSTTERSADNEVTQKVAALRDFRNEISQFYLRFQGGLDKLNQQNATDTTINDDKIREKDLSFLNDSIKNLITELVKKYIEYYFELNDSTMSKLIKNRTQQGTQQAILDKIKPNIFAFEYSNTTRQGEDVKPILHVDKSNKLLKEMLGELYKHSPAYPYSSILVKTNFGIILDIIDTCPNEVKTNTESNTIKQLLAGMQPTPANLNNQQYKDQHSPKSKKNLNEYLNASGIMTTISQKIFAYFILNIELAKRIFENALINDRVETNLVVNCFIKKEGSENKYLTKDQLDKGVDILINYNGIPSQLKTAQGNFYKLKISDENNNGNVTAKLRVYKDDLQNPLTYKIDNCEIPTRENPVLQYSYANSSYPFQGQTFGNLTEQYEMNGIQEYIKKIVPQSVTDSIHTIIFVFGITGSGKDTLLNHIYGRFFNNDNITDDDNQRGDNHIDDILNRLIPKDNPGLNLQYNIDDLEENWYYLNDAKTIETKTFKLKTAGEDSKRETIIDPKTGVGKYMRFSTPFNEQSTRGFNDKTFYISQAGRKSKMSIINVPGFEPMLSILYLSILKGQIKHKVSKNQNQIPGKDLFEYQRNGPVLIKHSYTYYIYDVLLHVCGNRIGLTKEIGYYNNHEIKNSNDVGKSIIEILEQSLYILVTLNIMAAILQNYNDLKNKMERKQGLINSESKVEFILNTVTGEDYMTRTYLKSVTNPRSAINVTHHDQFDVLKPFHQVKGKYCLIILGPKKQEKQDSFTTKNKYLEKLIEHLFVNQDSEGTNFKKLRYNFNVVRPSRYIKKETEQYKASDTDDLNERYAIDNTLLQTLSGFCEIRNGDKITE